MNVKGTTQVGQTPIRLNTDVVNDGGLSRSSDETPVMGVEQRTEVIQTSLDLSTSKGRMSNWDLSKGIPISKQMVWEAYKQVKRNKGGGGVDQQSLQDYDEYRSRYLYKLWNRLTSGSYFPSAVLEVEIPKEDGTKRKLGIPTVSDRIAQQVLKNYLEPRFEQEFIDQSYGYRPNRNAHQAIREVRNNVWNYKWVIDLDIKAFFDNVSHELLMKALKRHVSEKWVLLYIERWLKAPIEDQEGKQRYRTGKGTPQGGVISPLLSNLFLHYTFDKWMTRNYPNLEFVRYADDMIVHCSTLKEAETVLTSVKDRFQQCQLEVHEQKTKIVHCKKKGRSLKHPIVKFDFLGFTFKPRTTATRAGELFQSIDCAISQKKVVKIVRELRFSKLHRKTESTITKLAEEYNVKIRGWINYYGKFRWYELKTLFKRFNSRLIKWASIRYKRFKKSRVKAERWLRELSASYTDLFYHWKYSIFRTA